MATRTAMLRVVCCDHAALGASVVVTVDEALGLAEADRRLFTAVHEIGHAVAAMGTGKCTVHACAIEQSATAAGWTDFSEFRTDFSRQGRHAYLVALHGGHLAQERWLAEHGLLTPLRVRAVRQRAKHDIAAMAKTGAPSEAVEKAEREAAEHLDRNWPGLLAAAETLNQTGRISGGNIIIHLAKHRAPRAPARQAQSVRHAPQTAQAAAPSPSIAAARGLSPIFRPADVKTAAPIPADRFNRGQERVPTTAAAPHIQGKPTKQRGPGYGRSLNLDPQP